jgi:flagellar basal-body rod protein FlgG
MFQAPEGAQVTLPDSTSIAQGFLEQANVNVVESIAEMISIMRSFEMMTRTQRSFSKDIDQRLINEVGRV